jgi:hypothetical protein
MLRPTLLVGLGEEGADVARGVLAALAATAPEQAEVTAGMVITAAGPCSLREPAGATPSPARASGDAGLAGGGAGPDSAPPAAPGEWPDGVTGDEAAGADSGPLPPAEPAGDTGAEASPESCAEWHQAHLARVREMRTLLLRDVRHVRNQSTVAVLEQHGMRVSELLHVLVIAPCFDRVGSTALRVVLAVLDDLFRAVLDELSHELQLMLLSPDLFLGDAAGQEAAHARSYACVQELEATLEGAAGCRRIPVDGVWFCSNRNSADYFVEGGAAIVPLLVAHAAEVVCGTPASQPASSPSTRQRVLGRATRYSTFGQARLCFPRDELLAAARDVASGRELRDMPSLRRATLPVGTAFAQVGEFAREHLEGLDARLLITAERHPIFRPFDAAGLEATGDALVARVRARETEYRRLMGTMQQALDRRDGELRSSVRSALGDQVQRLARNRPAGALAQAQAWLAAAGNFPRGHDEYIDGEADAYANDSIPAVIEASWVERLEERFAHFLFHDDSELVREYLAQSPELHGNRRKLLRQLDEDIATRSRQLDGVEKERKQLEAEAEAEGERAAGRGEGEGGAVADLHVRLKEQALESKLETFSRLAADLERLFGVRLEVADQVKQIDAVIRDDVTRRGLIQRIEDAGRLEATRLQDEYLRLDAAHGESVAELEGARRRLLAWGGAALGAALLASAAAALKLSHWRAAAAVALLAVVAAVRWIWLGPYTRYRAADEKERDLRDESRQARAALLAHWDALARDRFADNVSATAARWSDWVPQLILQWNEALERLRDAVVAAGETARAGAAWRPEPEPSAEKLLPPGGVESLVEERQAELRARFDNYWQGHPFDGFVRDYLEGRASVEVLLDELRAAAGEAFDDLRAMSVEAYFESVVPPEARQHMIDRVFRAAAPLARGTARPHDPATELAFVALSDPLAKSVVLRTLLQLGHRAVDPRSSPSDTTVTLSRTATGFAAFQLAVLREARGCLLEHHLEDRRAFYAEPHRMEQLQDLVPSAGPWQPDPLVSMEREAAV